MGVQGRCTLVFGFGSGARLYGGSHRNVTGGALFVASMKYRRLHIYVSSINKTKYLDGAIYLTGFFVTTTQLKPGLWPPLLKRSQTRVSETRSAAWPVGVYKH